MALRMDQAFLELLDRLRVHPTPFRVRGLLGARVVVDSATALLVWEPRRVVPVYAVPRSDAAVPVRALGAPRSLTEAEQRRPLLDPRTPFAAHTASGTVVELEAGRPVEGFVCTDPDLVDHVLIDFAALTWFEEETEVFAHPRDPNHRIQVRTTRSRVQVLADGVPVVDTVRARRLWEPPLPVRWYVPEDDVLVPLEPSGTVTWCAYKGRATYRTAVVPDRRLEDVARVYEQPLEDGRDVQGLLGLFTERLEVLVDGHPEALPAFPDT